jgi:hypothetical protein
VDSRVGGSRVLAGFAAFAIVCAAVGSGHVAYGGTGAAAGAADSRTGTAAVVTVPVSIGAGSNVSRPAAPRDPVPVGWIAVTSPWLGYTVTVPDSWGLVGHVAPGVSRTPHDTFAGTVAGSETPTTLVIGSCRTADATVGGSATDVIAANGGTFSVTDPAPAGDGRVTMVATSVADDITW